MQDLSYLSIDELEDMREGLAEAIEILEEDFRMTILVPKEYRELMHAIDIELFERSVLNKGNEQD